MKATVLVGGVSLALLGTMGLLVYFHLTGTATGSTQSGILASQSGGGRESGQASSQQDMHDMVRLIRQQNETISRMTQLLEMATTHSGKVNTANEPELKEDQIVKGNLLHHYNLLISQKDQEIAKLKLQTPKTRAITTPEHTSTPITPTVSRYPAQSGQQGQECEAKYGYSLVKKWRDAKETWCEGQHSNIECYPYHQQHKKLDGRGPDMFCVGHNVVVDFGAIEGEVSDAGGHAKLTKYLKFKKGSLTSSCKKTSHWKSSLFMPHNVQQMASFQDGVHEPSSVDVEKVTTYLLARDEDCENSFHSTADFTNMHLVSHILEQDTNEQQVMLFDRHKDGPYTELISKAYAGGRALLRPDHYKRKKVMFTRLIFHLESPAGLIFPKVARPGQLRCKGTWLFTSYSEHVLKSFDLWNIAPPKVPHATMLIRNRTPSKNVGRVMSNLAEVEQVLKEGNMMTYEMVDTATLPFGKQLELIRRTSVLIGVHGAGLMLILFAAEESVLLEIHPSYRQDRHFRHASRMVGHNYIPIRSRTRESCHGSSDNVQVPIGEFRAALDGAIRLARQFDSGISECGLVCSGEILALDPVLDPYYGKLGMRKISKINTRFPC